MQELEGFTYATALDLNMGYYTIRLDPASQDMCTIVTPWGKYKYLRLPMGVMCAPDIFQEKNVKPHGRFRVRTNLLRRFIMSF